MICKKCSGGKCKKCVKRNASKDYPDCDCQHRGCDMGDSPKKERSKSDRSQRESNVRFNSYNDRSSKDIVNQDAYDRLIASFTD